MQQVHRLITDLGIERPVIVGHSYGALFVTGYAAQMGALRQARGWLH